MRYLRTFALALALAFLIVPAAPLGGVVPIPTVGGDAFADGSQSCTPEMIQNQVPCTLDTDPPGGDYGTPAPSAANEIICGILAAGVSYAERVVAENADGHRSAQIAAEILLAGAEAAYWAAGC